MMRSARQTASSARDWDAHLIVALTFPVFVVAALVRRAGGSAGGDASLLGEARAAARTCAAFALMG